MNAGATVDQTLKQSNSAKQSQEAKDADGEIRAGPICPKLFQRRHANRDRVAGRGPNHASAVNNTAAVEAGGDAVASKASVNAAAKIGQKLKQENSSKSA